jgi:hypothetical protein
MAECIRRSYTLISEMLCISSKQPILNMWCPKHCRYYSHYLPLRNLNKKNLKLKNDKQQTQTKCNSHILSNGYHCSHNHVIQFSCQPAFQYQVSDFNKYALLLITLKFFRTHLKRYRFVRHHVYSIVYYVIPVNSSLLTILLYSRLEQHSGIRTQLILYP